MGLKRFKIKYRVFNIVMSTSEIVIDWVHPENKSDQVAVKQSESIFWKVLHVLFIFLTGYFFGMITVYFIYNI